VINVGGNTAGTSALDMDAADILTASVARGAAVNLGPITSGSAMSSLSITAAEGAGNVTIGGIDRDNIFSGPNLSFTVPSGSTPYRLRDLVLDLWSMVLLRLVGQAVAQVRCV